MPNHNNSHFNLCRSVTDVINGKWYWLCLANALSSSPRTGSTRRGTPHVSTVCLSDVTVHDQISQAFPSVFAYCKQSHSGVGTAWERGYHLCRPTHVLACTKLAQAHPTMYCICLQLTTEVYRAVFVTDSSQSPQSWSYHSCGILASVPNPLTQSETEGLATWSGSTSRVYIKNAGIVYILAMYLQHSQVRGYKDNNHDCANNWCCNKITV